MGATVATSMSFDRSPTVAHCRHAARAVRQVVSRVPVTITYLGALWLVEVALGAAPGATRAAVVLRSSTNLANLAHGHLSTLVTSAFVHEGGFITREWAVLAALLAAAEWSWGSRRLVAVFVAGHVGATLIVAAGLTAGIAMGWAPPGLAHASDVGTSYGLMAVGAALTAQLPRWLRPVWAACWLADAGAAVLSGRTFTDAGHLIAFVIGLAIAVAWAVRWGDERSPHARPPTGVLANSLAALAFTQNAIVVPRVAASAVTWVSVVSIWWAIHQMLFGEPIRQLDPLTLPDGEHEPRSSDDLSGGSQLPRSRPRDCSSSLAT